MVTNLLLTAYSNSSITALFNGTIADFYDVPYSHNTWVTDDRRQTTERRQLVPNVSWTKTAGNNTVVATAYKISLNRIDGYRVNLTLLTIRPKRN